MKHLIYLVDGTWMFSGDMSAERTFTNIHNLNNLLEYSDKNEIPQIIYYKRGIGSAQERFKRVTNYMQGMFGLGIWNDIEEIYLNICSNFQSDNEPDKIYLFGFSRGAAAVRAVAELVDIGILHMNKLDHVSEGIEIYRKRIEVKKVSNAKPNVRTQKEAELADLESRFKVNCHSVKPRIEFLGLFDTVLGGVFLTRRLQELGILNSSPSNSVKTCVQLLAIDERRNLFKPSHFGFTNGRDDSTLEQIWMPGIHTDVGGGTRSSYISKIALLTMIDRAMHFTDLGFRFGDLYKFCNQDAPETTINYEFAEMKWKIGCALHWLNKGGKRSPWGANSYLHHACLLMQENAVNFKNRRRREFYNPGAFKKLKSADLFISNELRGGAISV